MSTSSGDTPPIMIVSVKIGAEQSSSSPT